MLFQPILNINNCVSPVEVSHVTSTFCETAVTCIPCTAAVSSIRNGLNRKMPVTGIYEKPWGTKHTILGLHKSISLHYWIVELPKAYANYRTVCMQDIIPPLGSSSRLRKPIVSKNLFMELEKPPIWQCSLCDISFTVPKRYGANVSHPIMAAASTSYSTFRLGETAEGDPTKHRLFIYQFYTKYKVSLTSKGNKNWRILFFYM